MSVDALGLWRGFDVNVPDSLVSQNVPSLPYTGIRFSSPSLQNRVHLLMPPLANGGTLVLVFLPSATGRTSPPNIFFAPTQGPAAVTWCLALGLPSPVRDIWSRKLTSMLDFNMCTLSVEELTWMGPWLWPQGDWAKAVALCEDVLDDNESSM